MVVRSLYVLCCCTVLALFVCDVSTGTSSVCGDGYKRQVYSFCFFFQAEDGIRDLVRSRGLGDVYKRQP